jgi:purine-binding chemotaxis protein CheW
VLQLVRFSVAGQDYALPIDRVREVIRYVEPRSLGEPEPWLRGVIDLRGELLRVCDLAVRLGMSSGSAGKIVVFDSPDGPAGLVVDEVDQVVAVDDTQLSPAPTARRELVQAIASIGDSLVLVLEPNGLLGERPPEPKPRRRTTPARKTSPATRRRKAP